MRCNCMNCGLFLADENNMQKEVYLQNKSLESLLQEGEILEKFREEGGSHSSSVREVIPLSPSHPLPLFLPYSTAVNSSTVPQREVAFPQTHRDLVEFETERRNIQRVNFSTHFTGSILGFQKKIN